VGRSSLFAEREDDSDEDFTETGANGDDEDDDEALFFRPTHVERIQQRGGGEGGGQRQGFFCVFSLFFAEKNSENSKQNFLRRQRHGFLYFFPFLRWFFNFFLNFLKFKIF
jgi:hypothetical protein